MNDDALLRRAEGGDREALGELLAAHDDRLARMVRFRMAPRMLARVGVSDVLQEVRIEAVQRFPEYARDPEMPLFLWLRFLTSQRIAALYRRHFGAQARDARREVPLDARDAPGVSVAAIAAQLTAGLTSPSVAVARAETERALRGAVAAMKPEDREVLSLRHFEQLSNAEVAAELGIDISAASKRYLRALRRLKEVLEDLPGLAV